MIPMNVKSFLYRVKREFWEIQVKEMQLAQIRATLLPSGIRYDIDKVQTSPTDPMSRIMARIDEMSRDVEKDLARLRADRRKAQDMINQLENPLERTVLNAYFLTPGINRMDDVAEMMCYSPRQVYRIYEDAINHVSECQSSP